MAGMQFDADAFGDPSELSSEDLEGIQSLSDLMGALKGASSGAQSKRKNQRLILERYIRDFEKSTAKKMKEVESKLNQFSNRGAPRTSSREELSRQVEALVERQKANFEKLEIQVEKEFDNIMTRLKTQKGLAEDFAKIKDVRSLLAQVMDGIEGQLENAKENLMDRGAKDMDRRSERSRLIQARKEAQKVGEIAQQKFMEENKNQLKPTIRENILGFLDRFLLMGRRGRLSDDQRESRRRDVVDRSKGAGGSAAKETFDKFLEQNPNIKQGIDAGQLAGFDFKAKGAGVGFRAQDLRPMFARVAGVVNAIAEINKQITQAIETGSRISKGAFSGKQSGAQIGTSLLTGNGSMGFISKFAEEVIDNLEVIATNTSQDVLPFSPMLIQANILSQLRTLELNVGRARKVEDVLSTLAISQNTFELQVKQLGDQLLDMLGPALVVLTNKASELVLGINMLLQMSEVFSQFAKSLGASNPIVSGIAYLMTQLSDTFRKEYERIKKLQYDIDPQISKQIEMFFANQEQRNAPPGERNNNIPKSIDQF